MTTDALTKPERDALIERLRDLDARIYPQAGTPEMTGEQRAVLREEYYVTLGEYADRLPRLPLSACPYCGAELKRVFDPYGTDGSWWHTDVEIKYDEPRACEHFKVLLGALRPNENHTIEAIAEVRPGPQVPFVVPALLNLPGMIAVISSVELTPGHIAYPIGYFSDQDINAIDLHQPWCRKDYWFTDEDGDASWSISNEAWDFDLQTYIDSGRLCWVEPGETKPKVLGKSDGAACSYIELPGERLPQQWVAGKISFLPLPTGEPLNPFG